jgi:hypothetical protein
MSQQPNIGSPVGQWTYRSFNNDPVRQDDHA